MLLPPGHASTRLCSAVCALRAGSRRPGFTPAMDPPHGPGHRGRAVGNLAGAGHLGLVAASRACRWRMLLCENGGTLLWGRRIGDFRCVIRSRRVLARRAPDRWAPRHGPGRAAAPRLWPGHAQVPRPSPRVTFASPSKGWWTCHGEHRPSAIVSRNRRVAARAFEPTADKAPKTEAAKRAVLDRAGSLPRETQAQAGPLRWTPGPTQQKPMGMNSSVTKRPAP